ncbi:5-methylthioadenosine/S-adenosylhomocysteine deaminase [Desulfamplus magnetovallimortis]|uniref:5-methylthioadenosine/S-adenosylhomocysteine deaminase n=1 Tax=Desulfamplus magnetovallimortis TaxID=1246637 RepID=A0A1W1HGR1_9BACT|nr:amidohydrolase [Desulfamplus magnetovallimortis]SLM31650.1 5-methylthioadenosine/S-adenosylhomocysteine deaminase [Desulfamplus magnetovallimortis]
MKILITNGTVLTMDRAMRCIKDGAVAVENGNIVKIDNKDRLAGFIEDESATCQIIDAKGGIIMPGLVNSHTHASMTLFRGLADDLPLMEWLTQHIFPAEALLTGELVHKGAMLACAEMIMSGTTCFCDMYLFENEVAKAASNCGMRAVVGEVLYDFPSPNYGALENGFEYVNNMMAQWRDDPLITVAVEPHATYTCAPELLQRASILAREHNAPLIIHVAETLSESEQINEKYGKSPAAFLADLGILSSNLIACHSIHLSKEDMELYKKYDVKVAHCPESNMKLASGVAKIPEMIDNGICVGLGTDGCASNNDLDMFLEMDTAAKLHKVFTMNPEAISAETALKMATINGAKALGLDTITGSIEVGKRADIIIVDSDRPHMIPLYNPYSHIVYSATGSDVSTTIIDGRVVMKNRKLISMNAEAVMDDVIQAAIKISQNDVKKP